jgi:signal transduction histidine kinase
LSIRAADSLRQTEARLGVLTGLRFSGEHSAYPADAVLRSYSELITGVLDISDSGAADIADPELARMRLASNALARVQDQMSVKRAIMAEAIAQGKLTNDRTRALLGAEAELASARNDYRTFANPDQQRMYDDTVIGMVVDIGNDMVESALTRAENNQLLTGLDADKWDVSATYTVNLAHQVQTALLVEAQERTDAMAAQARTSAIWDSGIVFGVLLAAGVLSVIIARSLLRPLRILRRSALAVAEQQLPAVVEGILTDPDPAPGNVERRLAVAPVPVFSREELGQVARAFDAVHGEAVRLAGEQALLRENVNSMFVNLSRRTQDLVERQLAVLDRMEAHEQDPDTLGGLFELDHLATRMRRNSENLLVLSGTEPGQAAASPVVADEIIGAALSEVEHYQRVKLCSTPELAVLAEAVNDLVHVISELLENATIYSGEQTTVSVVNETTETGAWRIEITDCGAGMPQVEIDRANARLANPPAVDVEVSRRMGLFVVAMLARRHNIDVRLSAVEDGGIRATVTVPAELVTEPPAPQEPAPPAVGLMVAEEEEPVASPPLASPLFPLLDPDLEAPAQPEPGPPRRAPVVGRAGTSDWPAQDDNFSVLELETPTERLASYQDVISRWFYPGTAPPRQTSAQPESEPGPPPTPRPREPEPEPQWPTVDEFAEMSSYQWPVERPLLSLSPEEVRERMSSLQGGVQRIRHARSDDGATT